MREQREVKQDFVDKVVKIRRVSKVVKGGRRFSFSALVVVGNKEGSIGWGLGKANEVPEAIRKGVERAKRDMVQVSLDGGTIPHEVIGAYAIVVIEKGTTDEFIAARKGSPLVIGIGKGEYLPN